MESNGKTTPPSWMPGIKQGEWQQITKPQLQSQQQPCYPLTTQVWATLLLHTAGYRGELAVRNAKRDPFTMADIGTELYTVAQAYYQQAGIKEPLKKLPHEAIRRSVVTLEERGICERRVENTPFRQIKPEQLKKLAKATIQIFCWHRPRQTEARIIKKYWHQTVTEAQTSTTSAKSFSVPKAFRVFNLPAPSKTKAADPAYCSQVEKAWNSAKDAFLQTLDDSKENKGENLTQTSPINLPLKSGLRDSPDFASSSPLPVRSQHPLGRGLLYKEEKKLKRKVEEEGPHHPPGTDTTTNGRMRMDPQKQYPITLTELRQRDPAVTEAFIQKLVTKTLEYCRNHPAVDPADLPKIDIDETIAAMCRESFHTGPRHHGIGLLLSRVPAIAVSWCQGDDDEKNRRQKQTA